METMAQSPVPMAVRNDIGASESDGRQPFALANAFICSASSWQPSRGMAL